MSQQAIAQIADDLKTIRSWSQAAPSVPLAEIDSVNAIIGDGASAMVPGIAAAIGVDFNAVITGCFLQEFDGNTGSVALEIQRSAGGPSPVWTRISPTTGPAIVSGRWFADDTAAGWDAQLSRGDYLRYIVTSAATIRRVHVRLRIRRLEP